MKAKTDKALGYGLFALIAVFMIVGYLSPDVHDSGLEPLCGVRKLLFYALEFYLPIFPIAAIVFAVFASKGGSKTIIGANLGMTIIFTIFAIAESCLVLSWVMFSLANIVLFVCAIMDELRKR